MGSPVDVAKALARDRGISYVIAKKMVHRRSEYMKTGRLGELSASLYSDAITPRPKTTPARRAIKNAKPAAFAYLSRIG
jgi:hypothetical protein